MRRNVCVGFAPRSAAASSSRGSRVATRALTATTTKETQNMMWAIVMARPPEGTPIMRNSVNRLEPMTTSGVAIGMKISRFVPERARKR